MIGRLGEIQSFDARSQEVLAALPLDVLVKNQPKSMELLQQLELAHEFFWEQFQSKPHLRWRVWRHWAVILPFNLEIVPKILRFLHDLDDGEKLSAFDSADNALLILTAWEFFRQTENDWVLREALLGNDSELLFWESEFVDRFLSPQERRARDLFQEIMRHESLDSTPELLEKLRFIMQHHPGDDHKSALVIHVRNSGVNDFSFLQ